MENDIELEVIREARKVIGGLEYSPEFDHFKVWTIHHCGFQPRLMYDRDEAIRWIREMHAEHLRRRG